MINISLNFFLACFIFFSLSGNGQNVSELKFDRLTTDDGLSQGMVNSILQDSYGFMWFASNDGLNRYDGNKFTVYKNDPNDNNSIAENFIRFLFEDSKGRIWIATAGNGLDLFNRDSETFTHFKSDPKNTNSISDNSVTCIREDGQGGIWVGTLHGLNRLVIADKKNIDKTHKTTTNATKLFFENHSATFRKIIFDSVNRTREVFSKDPNFLLADWRACNFFIDNQGLVWVSAREKLFWIKLLEGGGYQLENLQVGNYLPVNDKADGFQKHVQDFIPGAVPDIFYMLSQNGITEVNSSTGKIKFLTKTTPYKGIFCFPSALDNADQIWTADETFPRCFDTHTNTWLKISSADKNIDPLLSYISCTYKDRTGNIWLGTKGYGLLRYNPDKKKFNKTENSYIRFMTAGKDEKILFIKDPYDELFWEFNRETNTTHVPVPFSTFTKKHFSHFGNNTKSVLQDKDGSYWIGRVGLFHYDPATKKATEYWDNYEDVFPLYDDDHNNLWFGNTKGVVHFNKITKTSKQYDFPAQTTMGPYDYLQAIHRDKQGILWLGTLGGLYRFDPEKENWRLFKNITGDLNSLNNNLIFCITPDHGNPEKYLWIGTKGGGLNLFDKETGTFTHYTEKQGLSNDVVYGILCDSTGNLWVSTNKGISQFDVHTKVFKNYNVNDGLQGNEYNRNAFCKTESGYLYFGGITGFNYFDPAKLTASNYIPNVWITSINVLNKPLEFGHDNILDKPAYLTKSIELKYAQNMISFEFAATDFSAFRNNQFQYKLDGFDKDWIQAGINNTATYTNLDPGTYELKVKGSNSNGVWNEQPVTLMITILPPWYMTWWFRILMLLLVFTIAYSLHRYRLRKIIQMQKVRNAIAGDLHDEIGSNLSAIAVFSELASNPKKAPQEVSGLLKKITAYSQTSQDSMSDIVWMIDTKNDRLGALKLRMHSFANEVLEPKDIRLNFSSDSILDDVKLTMLQRKAVYLVFKESVNNILKYADASTVDIKISRQNNMIYLSVADNGTGFVIAEQQQKNLKGGNGLVNMRKRAQSINGQLTIVSSEGTGTVITLAFSA